MMPNSFQYSIVRIEHRRSEHGPSEYEQWSKKTWRDYRNSHGGTTSRTWPLHTFAYEHFNRASHPYSCCALVCILSYVIATAFASLDERTHQRGSASRSSVISMPHALSRTFALRSYAVLFFLCGCGPRIECDSSETREAVLKAVSDDHSNALGKFAATDSIAQPSGSNSKESKEPLYMLGEQIVTTSTFAGKRTSMCRGAISVIVGKTKATKEIEFTVQQSKGGELSVSVVPFQF